MAGACALLSGFRACVLLCGFLLLHSYLVSSQQSFSKTIGNVTVDFELFPIRSPNFGVLLQQSDGNFTSFAASSPRTYLGTVRGQPGAMASGLLKANGTLLCRISFENGVEWISIDKSLSVRGSTKWTPLWPTTLVPASTADAVLLVAEVGIDASYSQYAVSGSNVADTLDMLEFSVLAANVPFIRDASILHEIGKVVIRTSQSNDPYPGKATGTLLGEVRNQWNGVIKNVVGRTHHLALVVRPGAGGGLAYVKTVKTSWAYSANGADGTGDFSVIWRHEAGHNWGSNHYEGGGRPEGPTIMSDNQLSRFSSSELAKILSYKSKLSLPSTYYPRPPRANMDVATGRSSMTIDVVANDLDATFGGLQLISVQNPSTSGSTVQIFNQSVVYTPSSTAGSSVDYFSYRIQNVQGKTSTGYVMVRPQAFNLAGWRKTNANTGLTVQNQDDNMLLYAAA